MTIVITVLQAVLIFWGVYVVRSILREPEECRLSDEEIEEGRE